MDLQTFRKTFIREGLNITEDCGRIFSFIDFGNVNRWFDKDRQDWDNRPLPADARLRIDIEKLKNFSDVLSSRTRCYYGRDPLNPGSIAFSYALEKVFGKRDYNWKDLQTIKHYLEPAEAEGAKRLVIDDDGKKYIEIRKCNFDVEISVDATKMLNHYDTFCLFSSDSDFAYLNNFLRRKGKKVILIKAGYITGRLRKSTDLVINAQNVKQYVAKIEQNRTKT